MSTEVTLPSQTRDGKISGGPQEGSPPPGILVFLTPDGEVQFGLVEGGIQPGWAAPTVLRKAANMIEEQLL